MTASDRINQRLADRRKTAQSILAKYPEVRILCEALRDVLGAKLTYLEADGKIIGRLELGSKIGWGKPEKKAKKK